MFDTFTSPATPIWDGVRIVFSFLDRPAYALLGVIYELFFNVASADLFSNEMIMRFYTRVQIILGVYMMFQLAMTFLRGIVNPDNFEKDSTSFVTKAITALLIFGLLVPIGTGGGNEFEKQVNNNGLLFGTLYSLQHRILANNTIGRLVLGTNETETTFSNTAVEGDSELKQSARIFTSTILKGFYRINLVPEDQRVNKNDGKDPAIYNENRVCTDIDDSVLDAYKKVDAEPGEILDLVTATCDSEAAPSFLNNLKTGLQKLTGTTKYIFTFTPLISTITAIVFIFILLSFTIDVAVRAVKLAVLRLIAPIPIISYMNPQAGKDGAFNAWIKTLTSTYLDLFIRLASVYFVIFLIQDMIVNGVSISTTAGNGFLHVLSMIIIWIALFIFAKQAPKFIKQVLGLKEDVGKLFGGFGEIGAAMGMAAAVPGAIGSGLAHARASKMADETRAAFGEKDIFGNDIKPNGAFNKGKHLLAGITGGITSGLAGAGAAFSAKDHGFKASMEAMRQKNADALAKGNSGSTLLGRLESSGRSMIFGEGSAPALERQLQSLDSKQKALAAIKSRVSGEMVKMDWTSGDGGNGHTDVRGRSLDGVRFNHKEFVNAMEKAKASGSGTVKVNDIGGNTHDIDYKTAGKMQGMILKMNEDDYIQKITDPGDVHNDVELMSLIEDAQRKGAASAYMSDGKTLRQINGYTRAKADKITTRDDYTKVAESMAQETRELQRKNAINKANDLYSGQKK